MFNRLTKEEQKSIYYFNQEAYECWQQEKSKDSDASISELIKLAEKQMADHCFAIAERTFDSCLLHYPDLVPLCLGKFLCKKSILYSGDLLHVELSNFKFFEPINDSLFLDPIVESILKLADVDYMKYFSVFKKLELSRIKSLSANQNKITNVHQSDVNTKVNLAESATVLEYGNVFNKSWQLNDYGKLLIIKDFDDSSWHTLCDVNLIEKVIIESGVEVIPNEMFAGLNNLREVVLPKTMYRIEYAAFRFCKNLTSIDFPLGLITIAARAFDGCGNMIIEDLPLTLRYIGERAFSSYNGKELHVSRNCIVSAFNNGIKKLTD